jgi:hypothetical protein
LALSGKSQLVWNVTASFTPSTKYHFPMAITAIGTIKKGAAFAAPLVWLTADR